MRANKLRPLLVATIAVAFVADLSAHRRDEFLHAARIAVEADRVHLELSLTPGITVADLVIREIDQDDDGVLSRVEQQVYVERVLNHMTLAVDGDTPFRLAAAASSFPATGAMRNGEGTIAIESDIAFPLLPPGVHRLSFRNGSAAAAVVYLANALVPPDDRVTVTAQRRDVEQRELTVDFEVRGTPAASGERTAQWAWLGLASCLILTRPMLRRIWRSGDRTI